MSSPDAALGMGEAVEIVAYDPAWPAEFEHERALIARALGGRMLGIEHVGSTAVAGLGAKPIIDITVSVRRLADGENCVRPLEGLGYVYRGDGGIPGRLYFSSRRRDRAPTICTWWSMEATSGSATSCSGITCGSTRTRRTGTTG